MLLKLPTDYQNINNCFPKDAPEAAALQVYYTYP